DPKSSGLSYTFDRYLDAIQRAAEAAGYVLDRFDLPWMEKSASQPQTPITIATTQTLITLAASQMKVDQPEKTEDQLEALAKRQPGIILFRGTDGQGYKLLVVFLVGETPTAGVHKRALKEALDQVAWLSRQPKNHSPSALSPSPWFPMLGQIDS